MGTPPVLKRAFTLIELLIALSIMMSVLVLAATAFQLYTSTWERDLSSVTKHYERFRYGELFSDAIHSIIPVLVAENQVRGFYFLGREEGFTAVTDAPMFSTGAPAVVRILREQNDNGTFRLVYEEASLADAPLVEPSQVLSFTHRRIIYDDLPSLRFAYFGWNDVQSRVSFFADFASESKPTWFDEYDGMERQVHPQKVLVSIGGQDIIFLIPERSDLQHNAWDADNPV